MICKKCGTEISRTESYAQIIKKFNAAREFLESHPATGIRAFSTFENSLCFCVNSICKNGYYKPFKGNITLYYNKKNYKRYKKQFDKEIKVEPELKIFSRIDVPYKDHFGIPWKFDRIDWWGELSFVLFIGKSINKCYETKDWGSYQGVSANGNSFEELVINIANKFKEIFGNFSGEDFLTKTEKENHNMEFPFNFRGLKSHKGYSEMKRNRKYIKVTEAEINLRWKKWFLKTSYAKKYWPDLVKGEKK